MNLDAPSARPKTRANGQDWDQLVRVIAYGLIALALLAFIGYFVVYQIYSFALFRFPFDYDQGEGFELLDTLLFSRGQWPYRDSSVYPFYSSNYPPVYHLIIVPLVWLFGPQYWTGRLVSYLGTLVTAGAIGYAVQRESRRWWLAVLAGLAFLASNYVYHVGPLFRQHMFMVMFETLAVVVLTGVVTREEATGRRNNRGWLWVMLLLLLAGYTKQLAYATVAAVFLFLFLRQPRRALAWAVPFAAATGLIFLGLIAATQGHWWDNTVSANLNPFIPAQAIGLYRQWLRLHLFLTLAAAGLALYQLYFDRLSLYALWFVIGAANAVTAGKWGAGESYFATTVAASCILAGLAAGRGLQWARRAGWRRPVSAYTLTLAAIGLLSLLQAQRVFHLPTHTPLLQRVATALGQPTTVAIAPQTSCSAPRPPEPIPYLDAAGFTLLGRPPTAADTAAGQAIAAWIRQGETAAFSEEAGFNLYVGRDVVTNPTQLLNLYQAGRLDLTNMLDLLERQVFDTVIFRAQFYPPEVLATIGQRYETVALVPMNGFVYCVMQPRD